MKGNHDADVGSIGRKLSQLVAASDYGGVSPACESTDLMEDIARRTGNRFSMTRRGYLLVTREEKPEELLRQLYAGYGASASKLDQAARRCERKYSPPLSEDWQTAPDGVDVLLGRELIQQYYPAFDKEVATGLHIRRAGDISGQQLGQYMLEMMRPLGAEFQQARVVRHYDGRPLRG